MEQITRLRQGLSFTIRSTWLDLGRSLIFSLNASVGMCQRIMVQVSKGLAARRLSQKPVKNLLEIRLSVTITLRLFPALHPA